jgi:hypothetical protein
MKRTTITAPDELLQRLRHVADERHMSLAALIREALEEKAQYKRSRLRSLGIGASDHTDTAQRAGDGPDELAEKDQCHRPRPRSLGIGDSGHTDTARRTGDERPVPRSWR